MPTFQKKPVQIEAMRMPVDDSNHRPEQQAEVRLVAEWMADHGYEPDDDLDIDQADEAYVYNDKLLAEYGANYLEIETLEGTMTARPGDFVIKGVNGEFYPCKPDIFLKTYEPTDAESQAVFQEASSV